MARTRAGVVVALVLALAAGCGGGGTSGRVGTATSLTTVGPPKPRSDDLPPAPAPDPVVVAEASVPVVEVFDSAALAGPAPRTVPSPRPSGAPAVFLVQQRRGDAIEVLLPIRPNGSRGWVRASEVTLTQHRWRLVVELASHRLTLFQGPNVVRVETIGVGTQGTPTPGGRFFTTELLQPPDPEGPYGSFAYGLSGYTGAPGGSVGVEGQLGLHGTNDPSTLGRDVTLGCLRLSNEAMGALARQLPLGVPVDVRR